jgi:hypothetical protein
MNENQIFWNKQIIELRVYIDRQQQMINELESVGASGKANSVRYAMKKNFTELDRMVAEISEK